MPDERSKRQDMYIAGGAVALAVVVVLLIAL